MFCVFVPILKAFLLFQLVSMAIVHNHEEIGFSCEANWQIGEANAF